MYQLENFSEKDFLEAMQRNIKIFYMAFKVENSISETCLRECFLYPEINFLSVFFAKVEKVIFIKVAFYHF